MFAGAMEDVDARLGGRELVGKLAGAVGRIVVNDEHLERGRGQLADAGEQRFEIVEFVVGWDDNKGVQIRATSETIGFG